MKATDTRRTMRVCARSVLAVAVLLLCAATLCALPTPACASSQSGASTQAGASTQSGDSYSLTIVKCPASGQSFTAYRIVSWDSQSGTWSLDPALQGARDDTGIDVTAFDKDTDASVLRQAAVTYQGYVAQHADALAKYQATAEDGTAVVGEVEPGMYLVLGAIFQSDDYVYVPSPILVAVPASDEDGNLENDVTVDVKVTQSVKDHYKNRVEKLWKDDVSLGASASASRPESVCISIYNGADLYREVELNAQNSWSFEWEGTGDWSVRETSVPDGYTCAITQTAQTADDTQTTLFQVVNSHDSSDGHGAVVTGRLPKMGDVLPILGLVLVALGAGLVVAALGRHRRQEKSASGE